MFTAVIDSLLVGALLIPFLSYLEDKFRLSKIIEVFSTTLLVSTIYFIYRLYGVVSERGPITMPMPFSPFGTSFTIDLFSVSMAFLVAFLGLLAIIFSIKYMERETGLTQYYTSMVLLVAGTIGTVFSGDFLSLFIFWEIMCISSYGLVAFKKKNWEPIEAGLKYAVMSSSGSAFILMGMSYLYWISGTLNFAGIIQAFHPLSQNSLGLFSFTFLIIGFGIKAAMVPFHTWLPDAHPAAPSPVSSLLSGVVIKMGIYGLIRVVIPLFYPIELELQSIITLLAIFSMFSGNLLALLQTDLKRLLAYSSIANIGYLVLGLSLGTHAGLAGSMFHIINHALIKGLLFLVAGAFLYATGTRDLNLLAGVGRKMRVSGILFTLATLAMIGTPLLNGFMSEMYIMRACIGAGAYILVALMIANLAISAVYYLRTTYLVMFGRQSPEITDVKEVPMIMLIPMIVLATSCVIIGIFPHPFISFIENAASTVLPR